MTKSTYQEITNDLSVVIIKQTDLDGKVWWIPTDAANSDYQAYLKAVEHLTEIPPQAALSTPIIPGGN